MSLISLPAELLYEIFAVLDTKTLKSVASTCRSYNDLTAPIIFAEMDIDSGISYARSVDIMRTLSRDKRWSRRVQRINIISLHVPPPSLPKILRWRRHRIQELVKLLTKTLPRLSTLHTVFWRMRDTSDFSMELADKIVLALTKIPALKHLIIDSDTLEDPAKYQPCLSRVSNPCLKTLRYQGRVSDLTVQCLSSVLSNNTQLTKLDIQHAGPASNASRTTLLLSSIVSAEKSSLTEISLSGLKIDLTLAARLRSLTSLTTGAADFPPISDVWPLFQKHSIWLKEISVGLAVDQNLLGYLSAYASTLEKLIIKPGKDVEDLAVAFFRECLPDHAHTMKRLSVVPAYEGKWCLDTHNMGAILQCTNIESLVMSTHLPHEDEWLEADRYVMHRRSSLPFFFDVDCDHDQSIFTDFLRSLVQLRHLRYLRLLSARCLIYRDGFMPGGLREVPCAFLYHSCLYLQQICEHLTWSYAECPRSLVELHTDYAVYAVERQGEEYKLRRVEGVATVDYI